MDKTGPEAPKAQFLALFGRSQQLHYLVLLCFHSTHSDFVLSFLLMDHRQTFITASVDVYGNTPYPWQADVGAELVRNAKFGSCTPKLLIQPTGSGKSRVRDTVGILLNGISLTIIPLLSLGGDQFRKTIERCKSKNVTAFHLDELVKRPGQLQRLISKLDTLPADSIIGSRRHVGGRRNKV